MHHAIAITILAIFTSTFPSVTLAQNPVPEQAVSATSSAVDIQAIYQEGKKAYDRKDYLTARKKFGEASRIEPDNPRWLYNLGLTYRKLDNFQAARQAFLRARELDPNYKRAEIDDKLQSMGFDPAASSSSQPPSRNAVRQQDSQLGRPLVVDKPAGSTDVHQAQKTETTVPTGEHDAKKEENTIVNLLIGLFCCFGMPAFIIIAIVMIIRRLSGKSGDRKQPQQPSAPRFDPQQLAAEEAKLADAAIRLTRVEHVMRLGEHQDLRNLLEHATRNEQAAWKALHKVRSGDNSAFGQLQRTASEASAASQRAIDLATQVYGDRAFAGQGERIGCFFCARPLANPDYRRRVTLKRGDSQDEVVSCPDCAALTERGESPTIRTGDDGHSHWSEHPDYDPYAMRHGETGSMRQVEAWRYEPQQPISHLSQLATGGALLGVGALAGAGVAMAASHFFDLDSARQSGLEHDALNEAARQATGRRRRSHDYDHS